MASPAARWQEAVEAWRKGDIRSAHRAVRRLIDGGVVDADVFLLAGLVECHLEAWERACSCLRESVRLEPGKLDAWLTFGNAALMQRDFDEAGRAFQTVLAARPDHALAHNNLGVVYEESGQLVHALAAYEQALRAEPGYRDARIARARVLAALNRFEAAREAHEELLRLYPGEAELALAFAALLEKANRPGEAATWLPEADALGAAERIAEAEALRARLQERHGDAEGALATLEAARERTGRETLGFPIGRLLDRLGRPDRAIVALDRANRARAADPHVQRVRRSADYAAWLDDRLARGVPPAASDAAADPAAPVFVVGLPRSGTTLLGRILGAHPAIHVLEELEALHAAEKALDRGEPEDAARQVYWTHVRERETLADGAIALDKYPLNASALATVARLFPGAVVIYALRHPYDAALSCYMQDFLPTRANVTFLGRQSTGATCRRLLQLMEAFERARPERVLRVHHERVVADRREALAPVLAALGLDWHADMADHTAMAAGAGLINSASYEQVTRPIDDRSIGRWHHYPEWVDAVRPALADLLPYWGYGED